jgi:hypothetical protein
VKSRMLVDLSFDKTPRPVESLSRAAFRSVNENLFSWRRILKTELQINWFP